MKARPGLRLRLVRMLMVWLAVASVSLAWGGSIDAEHAALNATDDGYALAANFRIDLGPRVEEAVAHGVALYFKLEFELTRSHWYWPGGEHVAGQVISYRLSYNPLTQKYRLGTPPLFRSFDSLDDALRALARVSALPVVERGVLKAGDTYQAAVRLSLDHSQLPKPFQLDAIGNRDWTISSKPLRWQPTVEVK